MKLNSWRDDSFMDRLHSFLKGKGDFDCLEIIPVKKNVFKVYAENQWWIVKCYGSNALKVWSLSLQIENRNHFVTFVPFPNGERWLKDSAGQYWCLSPFVEGKKLNYNNHEDREAAIELLQQFHTITKGLSIKQTKPKPFIQKTEERYKRFLRTKDIFVQNQATLFYNKIVTQTNKLLKSMEKLKWRKIEEKAKRNRFLIHGDNAGHNFIRNSEGIYLIDFDLIQYAPYEYEWIQLAQRFLIEGLNRFDDLFQYPIFQSLENQSYFLYGTLFPSDLFREWLHFLRNNPSQKEIASYLQKFQHLWTQRQKFFDRATKYGKIYHYSKEEGNHDMKNQIDQLTKWLQDQVKESGVNGLLVGISGGIDSAVVAHLIKRAFPNDSLGVIMPCKSNPDDKKFAEMVVESSGIKSIKVDLTESHEVLYSTIQNQLKEQNELNESKARLADANLRARLRMSTLYTMATNYGYLVTGTDNAAEWYTGYFTKFGDGGVDLVPLLHFTKGEVRELAKELGVPDEIINKAPSAGLWEGQTDEHEMGTTYDNIDKYIRGESVPEEDKNIIENMHERTAHKRELPKSPPKF
ncbi:NAD+ synthetase [Salinibacillus kushneri]|uniref:NH(3)-dependent NAD(+) synthetase n=2 Tax=Salinibacillus kushneri TaxID=237682 RepID=A0A1I0GA36_9BACI|nr:NAD+ synthetase [Salinibacillus kushneri]